MKYPAIIRNDNEIEMLLLNEGSAIILSGAHKGQVHDVFPRFRRRYVDITHEYLSNTWGVVESKEHAEFIIELAKLHGFSVFMPICSVNHFVITDVLSFHNCEKIKSTDLKQVTIPLPPKAKDEEKISYTIKKGIQPKKDCEDFELTGVDSIGCAAAVSVSFNDNDEIVSVECENSLSKAKEWPCIGDRVRWDKTDYSGTVKAVSEGKAWCKLDSGLYHTINFDRLKKPKTEQELKIEELQTKLCNNNAVDNYILACDIINGEIEGLSYEP